VHLRQRIIVTIPSSMTSAVGCCVGVEVHATSADPINAATIKAARFA
jgi:hypothetical protein